jgi:transcriptional regulator with PAS, ATPase and Fis domain
MGEDLGCLYLYIAADRLPLTKENAAFLTSLGRHFAGNLRLMINFEERLETRAKPGKESEETRASGKEAHRFEHLVCESEQMKDILKMLEKIKNKTPNILLVGESGTGKTELARAVHFNGPRSGKPFQPIHCAQIPDTLIESELFGHERGSFTGAYRRKIGLCEIADGGTIFLDDVNAIPPETQKKLLNFIETKSFMRIGGDRMLHADVRIIAASNEDLENLCKEGKFREDLYYRLKVIFIRIPPLRERKEDIAAIAQTFLKKRCKELGIPLKTLAPETMRLFQRSPWGGNVRELQNVLERVLLLADDAVIYPASLPEDALTEVSGTDTHRTKNVLALAKEIIALENYSESNPLMPQMEALLAKLMVEHAKAKGKAAALLGITKPTLYSRLDKYDDFET